METRAIEYVIVECALGRLLVAASARGVCLVQFGDDEQELAELAQAHFPWACLRQGGRRLECYASDIAACAAGHPLRREIPLDVSGSRFQQRVWAALREIPHAETRSYGLVAGAIGRPGAARAVARACASNPVPLLVPCHRVVRADGSTGGYRGGAARKRSLLEAEREQARSIERFKVPA